MFRRPVIIGVALATVIGALGLVALIGAEMDARQQEADAARLLDRLEWAVRLDELATSTLNLSHSLKGDDPIDEIAEDIDDERELAEHQIIQASLEVDHVDRIQDLLDEVQGHVEEERFALDPSTVLDLSSRLRAEATEVASSALPHVFGDLAAADALAARLGAATLMADVVVAMQNGTELSDELVDGLDDQLAALASSSSASTFDPEVNLALDEPAADIDTLDHLSEIVVTMTTGLEELAADADPSADRGAVLAYAAAFALAATSLIGLLTADRISRRREMDRLRSAVGRDELTGAANRTQLHNAYKLLRPRKSRPLGLIYIDLDRFKPINDSFGHHVGDEVLRLVVKRIRESVREDDTVARMGGDEFVALISGPRERDEILAVAERAIARLNEDMIVEGQRVDLGASGGATIVTLQSVDLAEALRDADAALFAAKKAGRGQLLTSAALTELESELPVASRR